MKIDKQKLFNCSSLTLDKFIGPVVEVEFDGEYENLFLCCGKWVAFSECEESCPHFCSCSTIAQVNMVGSEEYGDGLEN